MANVPEIFGSLAFNDKVMRERLSKEAYEALKKTIMSGDTLDSELANSIATAMKDWAIEKGATHYTHWFQPMTGITAEKHDSFLTPKSDGTAIMRFSGKELIKGESDASSFPSGGLRSTFEARGYTAWDPSSYAFIKDGTLCIPTAFIAYNGQVLDKKTPLLRSVRVLCNQVKRFLKLFGKNCDHVNVTVGAEQEYFIVDRDMFLSRMDLRLTGRTLFGARPPKGQELEDHYYGNIRQRVLVFMTELDEELWKVGIPCRTRHNEAAPAQHELAPIYESVSVATDHNQLAMEIMRKVAEKHNLKCLLHEKPFAGVNGSGKHNNWSVSTSDGENLLDPGKIPESNLQFLLFLSAIIKAVDLHQDLLRLSVATAGNDHRLGASEAPPAIISIFLGSELTEIFESIAGETSYEHRNADSVSLGVESIPAFMRDTTDRNRTSPLAFTGNKFEFRMPGSSINIACPNIMINTAIADVLCEFCNELEKSKNLEVDIKRLIRDTYIAHSRIVFNGNNYSSEWEKEAQRRGLLNLPYAVDAMGYYTLPKNIALFEKYKVYSKAEVEARQEIIFENYSKIINIEALTMLNMVTKEILPAAFSYMEALSKGIERKQKICIAAKTEVAILKQINSICELAYKTKALLELALKEAKAETDLKKSAKLFQSKVFTTMQQLRTYCDELETLVAKTHWPFATYSELLFSV